jgi:SAM-dependent methyltransferase
MSHDTIRHPYGEFEHAGWQRAAPAYADTFGRISSTFIPELLDSVGITTGTVLLDVACGPGLVSAAAAARGARVTGVDFSPNMVAEARRRNPAMTFQEGDAESLPFADASFDAVVIGFGLHHFPSPGRAIAEARRVLRPGGRLGFTTWAPPEDHVTHQIVLGAVREAGNAGAALPVAPGGPVNQTDICLRLLQDAGFDATHCQTQILRKHLRLESATELIGMLEAGTVRLSTTLRSQPADKTAAIHAAVERNMAPYRVTDGYRFPVAAILGAAAR